MGRDNKIDLGTAVKPRYDLYSAHILVIDDDDRIRALLKKYLAANGFLVSAAPDADSAEKLIESIAFDLLVVDRMMPGKDGADLVRDLRARGLAVPAIMLTAVSDVDSRIGGLSAGADDYLPKPFEPKELLLRINNVLRRVRPRAKDSISVGGGSYDPASGVFDAGSGLVKLTSTEKSVMNRLIEGAGSAVGRDELASCLGSVSERNADVVVARIRGKIERDPKAPEIILTVRNEGYKIIT
ncbi:MAG: response regulator transcription factor [Rickettsiales bacterium]|jgi:two-component system phosphate regulon response regulator OmpR|nr:response regulator transcription factor [Rickettsiales bacterium]